MLEEYAASIRPPQTPGAGLHQNARVDNQRFP